MRANNYYKEIDKQWHDLIVKREANIAPHANLLPENLAEEIIKNGKKELKSLNKRIAEAEEKIAEAEEKIKELATKRHEALEVIPQFRLHTDFNGETKKIPIDPIYRSNEKTLAIEQESDIIAKGAVPQGQPVKIAAWGHKWDNLPAGKGKIYERGNELIVDGEFFMDTQAGVETYKTVKNLGDLQEWSFGFEILQSHEDSRNGKTVRVLDSLNVFEVSPVLVGAGVNTRTTAIKSKKSPNSPGL